jgi:hypothetical protein
VNHPDDIESVLVKHARTMGRDDYTTVLERALGLGLLTSDGELWRLWYTSVAPPEKMGEYVAAALDMRERLGALPFVVRDNASGDIVGSTRYFNVETAHRRLEIGHTWLGARAQRTAINTECKLLLLTHAFETQLLVLGLLLQLRVTRQRHHADKRENGDRHQHFEQREAVRSGRKTARPAPECAQAHSSESVGNPGGLPGGLPGVGVDPSVPSSAPSVPGAPVPAHCVPPAPPPAPPTASP